MEPMLDLISWQRLGITIAVYFTTLAFYRLFLHPLSRFPGPRLAAASRWYEAYYDVVKDGQYVFKIAELHKRYGPIIRISPHELHVNDAAFLDQLYRQDGIWDKHAWSVDAFATCGATMLTPQHELHKARRQPLNPFFSKARVASRVDMIAGHLEKLCGRISAFVESGEQFNLGAAITAFTRDVAFDFILGKSYRSLDAEDFDEVMLSATRGSGQVWRLGKHLRFVGPMLKAMPVDWVIKYGEHVTKIFFRFLKVNMEDTERLVASRGSPETAPSNMVHEIMESKLPELEKTTTRIFDDVAVITGAGFETTAGALRVALFHLFDKPDILQRLRAELATIDTRDLKATEQLPYLKVVLLEGLRMSPALGARLSRIAPDRELLYGKWRIPAGTPVSMSLILLHADEAIYPEPLNFNPGRWMDSSGGPRLEKRFAPFLKGTRGCLGMHLAWAEMNVLMAGLVDRFDFQFRDARAEDFESDSDQFALGTRGKGVLNATVCRKSR
ncbi:cytochrome P450 [Apiospora saccharicola]|uniref:Cytochrome P450 n=1 Tax=Apiospora saccharicola TaxID=335842 RepID=A0ABR1THT2_9PEZI